MANMGVRLCETLAWVRLYETQQRIMPAVLPLQDMHRAVALTNGYLLDECSHLTLEDIEFGERSGHVMIRQDKGNKAVVCRNTWIWLTFDTAGEPSNPL